VRALTRIATPDTEAELVEMATPMTAGQLKRFARAHRRASGAGNGGARPERRLGWHFQDEHELAFNADDLADALVEICAAYLRDKAATLTTPTPTRSSSTSAPRP
jgi:hypothetical protein